jgi:serine/threonine protein kinase
VQVLLALQYLHTFFEVPHRDVKPQNILINSEGRVKLCDFDTVYILTANGPSTIVGTERYCAPEVSLERSGQPYTARCDLYSLGVVLLEVANPAFTPSLTFGDRNARSTAEELQTALDAVEHKPLRDILRKMLDPIAESRCDAFEALSDSFFGGDYTFTTSRKAREAFYEIGIQIGDSEREEILRWKEASRATTPSVEDMMRALIKLRQQNAMASVASFVGGIDDAKL